MGIDTSMYNNNPANTLTSNFESGIRLGDLGRQRAEENQVKQVFAKNLVTGPDGKPSLNEDGVVRDLAPINPQKALQFQQMQLERAKAQREQQSEVMKQKSQQIDLIGKLAGSSTDQDSYTRNVETARKLGLDVSAMPPQFDPDYIKHIQMSSLSAKDQMDEQMKKMNFDQKERELGLKHEENQIKRQELGNTKQNQAMGDVVKTLESARGNPAAAQAEKDLYAASKFDSLFNLYGDPNKLNPQQVQLAATEVAKIASGGVPSIHELQGLNPSTLPKSLADLAQRVTNNPHSADAGAFVQAMKDYTDSLKVDAKKVISDKYGRVIESNKDRLGKKNYESVKAQYLNRFDPSETKPPSAGTVRMKDPQGNIREIPADQAEAAKAAGGVPL